MAFERPNRIARHLVLRVADHHGNSVNGSIGNSINFQSRQHLAISDRFHEEPIELEVWHGRLRRYYRKDSVGQLPVGGLAQAGFNRGRFQLVEVCK
mgnify:FL=1